MIILSESTNEGYFKLNGIDYVQGDYGLRYSGEIEVEEDRAFSVYNIHSNLDLISARHYDDVIGVTSWDELSQLLIELGVISATSGTSIDVNVQDQTSALIIASFSKEDASTVLSVAGSIDSYEITVSDSTGFTVGDYMSIFSVIDNRFYLANILEVDVNTFTLDTPLDFAFPIGSFVTSGNKNMNVDGSVTPVIYGVRNTEEQIGSAFDIVRIIIHCETTDAIDLSKFGDISGGLLRGIVMRKVDGIQRNVFNAKTNGDLKNLMFDLDIESASNPQQGQNGFTGRMTFGGQSKMGVVIRLNQGEDLQLIIQDDLTGLEKFEIICEGHTVV